MGAEEEEEGCIYRLDNVVSVSKQGTEGNKQPAGLTVLLFFRRGPAFEIRFGQSTNPSLACFVLFCSFYCHEGKGRAEQQRGEGGGRGVRSRFSTSILYTIIIVTYYQVQYTISVWNGP